MKRTLLILVLILIGVWAALSLLSAGDEYAAEKIFYRAMKTNEKIVLNPEVVPPALFTSVESDLQKILKKYPKSNITKTARISLAEFYLGNKKYDKALSAVDSVMKTYPDDQLILSKAQFLKGAVYEKQDKWDRAVSEYVILRDKYGDTPLGMEIPLYIGKRYAAKERRQEAEDAFNEAAAFYQRKESQNRQKAMGYVASNLLVQAYMNLGKYEQAGVVVKNTINNYPGTQTYLQQLPLAEVIYIRFLKSPHKLIEIYNEVIGQTKDEKLKDFLKDRIKKLEEQK